MIKVTRACKISKKELRLGTKRIEKRYKTLQSTATGMGEFLFPMAKMHTGILK